MSIVWRAGRRDVEARGELDTRNDAVVDANAFNPRCTGVYAPCGPEAAGVLGGARWENSWWPRSSSCCLRFRARWREMRSTTSWTGLARVNGKRLEIEVSKLGAIISCVTTSGLKGTIPVFENAASIFALVKARACALV